MSRRVADTVCPRPPVTLSFDRLTLKLVCESHLRWETFNPNLGTLGLWVLKLFAIYATEGQTDGQTDGRTKATLITPFLRSGNNNHNNHRLNGVFDGVCHAGYELKRKVGRGVLKNTCLEMHTNIFRSISDS